MNLRDLSYLIAVAEELHFGKAALRTHVSQPTLSMQLKKLEDELGVTLFERNNKHVIITPIGKEIIRRARMILHEVDALKDTAKQAQDPFSGLFRLGAFPTLAPYFLPKAVREISLSYPKLQLELVEEKTEQLLARLHEGSLDAALLALPITSNQLESLFLFEDPFVLAVPKGHQFSYRESIKQTDLEGENLLLLEEGHCLRDQALSVCHFSGAKEQKAFRATSLETLREMVVASLGITLLPTIALRHHDQLKTIPFVDPVPVRCIGLVFRKHTAIYLCIEGIAEVMSHYFAKSG